MADSKNKKTSSVDTAAKNTEDKKVEQKPTNVTAKAK